MNDAEMTQMSKKDPELCKEEEPIKLHWFEAYLQPCVAELLGTSLFVFIGCLSVIENGTTTGNLQPALAHGLSLGLIIGVLGGISGGHFNPAVSLAAWLIGGLNLILLIPYWVCQLCGGMIGAAMAMAVSAKGNYENATGAAFTTVTSDGGAARAVGAEIIMTFLLVFVVCMGAINGKSQTSLAPFCIGFTVTVDIIAGAAISGACMNPARAFGPAVVANYWTFHWIYWIGPLAGGLLVAATVRLLLGDKKIRVFFK
ncbi:hypothetical protein GDO86_017945 [Hymenochirus boettgeri]|uniref:Aquaporin-8 n=1 Tax=Hymenochirus boettgeri TaxID=247094 RepID=A0A8T2IGN8_9PIPI|nr:hypothetical protein GDO86_017945 [Hymenochirus boettgeri]